MTDSSHFMTVIIATCHSKDWLEKTLFGYLFQTHKNFEIIVAENGSNRETAKLIAGCEQRAPFPIRHIWQEDLGYGKQAILNKAIAQAGYDYVLITNGACIPRRDFLEIHARNAKRGRYLSGGCCNLEADLSWKIRPENIASGDCFKPSWLTRHGRMDLGNRVKLGAGGAVARFLDAILPPKPAFTRGNVSAWKSDLLAVNGYDEKIEGERAEYELAERLTNSGIKGAQVAHRAICLHLDASP